jgi:hypothetical protein
MTQRYLEVEHGKSFPFQPQIMISAMSETTFKNRLQLANFSILFDLSFPLSQESYFSFFYINLTFTYYINNFFFFFKEINIFNKEELLSRKREKPLVE